MQKLKHALDVVKLYYFLREVIWKTWVFVPWDYTFSVYSLWTIPSSLVECVAGFNLCVRMIHWWYLKKKFCRSETKNMSQRQASILYTLTYMHMLDPLGRLCQINMKCWSSFGGHSRPSFLSGGGMRKFVTSWVYEVQMPLRWCYVKTVWPGEFKAGHVSVPHFRKVISCFDC